ncbi:serine hydrolase [bacterium]|nr:serine hydrolase [bacterium]
MLDQSKLRALRDRAQRDVDAGLQHGGVEGCSLAIGYQGEIVFAEAFGAAGVDTPFVIMSPTKTVMEAAMWVLYGGGKIAPGDRAAEFVPEFASNGKDAITLEMLQTHTAALASQQIGNPDHEDREKRLAAFARWKPDGEPGSFYEYNVGSGNWVLAEIIERISGTDYREFLKREVLEPLGLADIAMLSLGAPEEDQKRTLKPINCVHGWVPDPSKRPSAVLEYDTEHGLSVGVPGSGAVGTPSGLALLYQAYLHNPKGLWNEEVLEDARSNVRVRMSDPLGRPVTRTLSFHLAGEPDERYSERTFFGALTSPAAFGHQGQGGQIVWADPATGLSFSYLTNTVVFPPGGCFHPRARELSTIAAQALGS